jgi:predicted TIM-barrel fold metal-dependent hydrolase
MPMPYFYGPETQENLIHPPFEKNAKVENFDDYLDVVGRYILRVKKEGAVGLKMHSYPYTEPDKKEAMDIFKKLISGTDFKLDVSNPLRSYIVDWAIKFAGQQGLIIAVHPGYWGDFRELDPLNMIPILQRHPNVKFDIYHLGYPWVRETLMLCKGFPNVWLNFCWTHIISQKFAMAGLDEAIDLVPVNKILAFGGDYNTPVEKVYGHLVMAREDIAKVLARRIEDGQFTESQALTLAKKWFWDNPIELYKLGNVKDSMK